VKQIRNKEEEEEEEEEGEEQEEEETIFPFIPVPTLFLNGSTPKGH
jgi:hypothetical protein